MFLKGERVDMPALADELGVSSKTLYGWCGERDQLLGEIVGSLSEELLRRAKADHVEHSGAGRILAIYRQYLGALARILQQGCDVSVWRDGEEWGWSRPPRAIGFAGFAV
jgi:hypothetical protein